MTQPSPYTRRARRVMYLFAVSLSMLFATLCMLTLGAPAALADSFEVTLAQNGSNVNVVVTALPGFSIKTGDGNDVEFNFAVSASQITNLSADGGAFTNLTFNLGSGQVDGIGTYATILGGISGGNLPNNQASVASYSFTVTGVTVAQLETTNGSGFNFGAHICPGPEPGCANNTFFSGTNSTVVPEPTSMLLFGTGMVVLGRKLRRRKSGSLVVA